MPQRNKDFGKNFFAKKFSPSPFQEIHINDRQWKGSKLNVEPTNNFISLVEKTWRVPVPYELSFKKSLAIPDTDLYINECCWGGDQVTDRLLPAISERYEDVERDQEDWGWFIWFRKGPIGLAIDVFCDDPAEGAFRVHLTSRQKRWLVFDRVVDTQELDDLKDLVVREVEAWTNATCNVVRLDANYM